MRLARDASVELSARHGRPQLLLLIAAIAIVFGCLIAGRGSGSDGKLTAAQPTDADVTPPPLARRAGTRSLAAASGRWKAYIASATVCPGANRRNAPAAEQANTMVCMINFARGQRGLRSLVVTGRLNRAAQYKADAIRRCNTFAHNPCGGNWVSTVRATGYKGAAGENLYFASNHYGTPRAALLAWLNSPPHRENLFRAGWRLQGLALMTLPQFNGARNVSVWVSVLGG